MDPAREASAELDAIRATFGEYGEVAALAHALDWSQTALGMVHRWPPLLSSMVRLAMASPRPVSVCWGPDAVVIWNDASVPALHGKLRQVFARPLSTAFPEAAEYARTLTSRVLGGESVTEFGQHVPLSRDGKVEDVWFDLECTPIREADGTVTGSFNVWRECIAEAALRDRENAELAQQANDARNAYLLALSDRLRSLRDPIAIQRAASEMLAEHFQVARSYYAEYDDDGGYAYVRTDSLRGDAPTMVGVYRLTDFVEQVRQMRAGVPLVVDDWREAGLAEAGAAELSKRRSRGQITVPLVKEGKLVAALSVNDTRPRRWSDRDVELVAETAERTWAAVERARVELALRQSEQRARTLLAEATAARAQAEEANRAKDEFLTTLSHELRTPLAAIHLWAGALRSGAVPLNDLTRAIDAIAQSAESQSRLIEDLLDLSRLTSGKLVLTRSPVDVHRVAHAALETVKPLAVAKGIALSAEIRGDLGVATLDGDRVKQVLWNLLANAVKFTPTGGSATLRARRRVGQIELEVMDTGEGIAPEFLPHVFERFRQADMAETREHTGLGIGLALAKQLVELHGGTITAHSEGLGCGAAFRVLLPFVGSEMLQHKGVPSTGAASTGVATPLAGVGVLLVEDDATTQDAMRWTLERAGASVRVAASAHEALAALEPGDAESVIVSDLGLPGMSGFELMERIVDDHRKRGRRPPPSCAVSAHARDVDRRRAIEAGFDIYLTKPVTPERLVEAVTDLRDVLATPE